MTGPKRARAKTNGLRCQSKIVYHADLIVQCTRDVGHPMIEVPRVDPTNGQTYMFLEEGHKWGRPGSNRIRWPDRAALPSGWRP